MPEKNLCFPVFPTLLPGAGGCSYVSCCSREWCTLLVARLVDVEPVNIHLAADTLCWMTDRNRVWCFTLLSALPSPRSTPSPCLCFLPQSACERLHSTFSVIPPCVDGLEYLITLFAREGQEGGPPASPGTLPIPDCAQASLSLFRLLNHLCGEIPSLARDLLERYQKPPHSLSSLSSWYSFSLKSSSVLLSVSSFLLFLFVLLSLSVLPRPHVSAPLVGPPPGSPSQGARSRPLLGGHTPRVTSAAGHPRDPLRLLAAPMTFLLCAWVCHYCTAQLVRAILPRSSRTRSI